jgi:hypothetical protein
VRLRPHDIVDHQGVAYRVEGLVNYRLDGQAVRFARLVGDGQARFLELPGDGMADRLVLLSEIETLDLTTPPPATIYHGGESFLLKQSGTATVSVVGEMPGFEPGGCQLWRYRAAGGRLLQIEAWPNKIRMLEGASVHRSMLEMRPATT